MVPMPQIQTIESSRVVHELILKPLGEYIVRASNENDDIVSQIKLEPEMNARPYVVLSVRVNENEYPCPIINYRLPLIGSNGEEDSTHLLKYYTQYKNKSEIGKLPELKHELIVKEKDTNWKIEEHLFETKYRLLFSSNDDNDITDGTICNFPDGSGEIKVFRKFFKNDEQGFQQEFSILKNLSYFHIVSFYGIGSESDQINKYLVFVHNGESLKSKCPEIKCTDKLMTKQLSIIGYQIACGMIYLEYKNIIHRDLHAGNILIDKHNFIRIADFGHAIIKDDDDDRFQQSIKNSKQSFKRRLLAPECLPSLSENGEIIDSNETLLSKFSSKSDVWAYGLIFIELMLDVDTDFLYPCLPSGCNDCEEYCQFIHHVKLGHKIHGKPDDCPDDLYNVLKRCWIYDPEERISFMDVRNEMLRLFQSIDI